MTKIEMPFVRRLGVDIDNTVADTSKHIAAYVQERHGIHVSLDIVQRVGVTKAFYMLSKEQLNEALAASWRDPSVIELIDPRIPDLLRTTCEGEMVRFIPVGVTASRGENSNIREWVRDNDVPFEEILQKKRQMEKAQANVDLQLEDSPKVAKAFADLGKPVVMVTDANPELQQLLTPQGFVHYSTWPDIPKYLQGNLRLLNQLGVTQELEYVDIR